VPDLPARFGRGPRSSTQTRHVVSPYCVQLITPLLSGGAQLAFRSAVQFAFGHMLCAHWVVCPSSVGSTPSNLNRGIIDQTQSGNCPLPFCPGTGMELWVVHPPV